MAIKKNGVIAANIFSTNGLLEDMEQKYFEGAQWAKVFDHNNKGGTAVFSSIAEVKNSNVTNKYSRIYLLDKFKAKDNKIEFLLEYPDDVAGKYNRWKQTNNPCNEFVTQTAAGDGKVAGYEAIHVDWTGNYWGGIARQSSDATAFSNTYLDGSVGHSNWFYAIGSVSYQGGIPGPGVVITGRVQLWVRIDTLHDETKAQITKQGCFAANDFYEI